MRRPHPLFWFTLVLGALAGTYAIFSLLGLAFEGRLFQRFELGGAAAHAGLGQAAGEFAAFRDEILAQLEDLDQTLGDLDARINDLESGVP